MNKIILFLCLTLSFNTSAIASTKCFIALEGEQVIKKEGDCESRYTPCSTFKIAISLMGYNEGLLIDEIHPEWPYKNGYVDWLDKWKQPHNLRLWIKNSSVWYSQILTQKLGTDKFKEHIKKFNYGNLNISGDKGRDNGLTNSWLSSFLEISPIEQVYFLQKLINNKLSVSIKSHEMTKKILFIEKLVDSWMLYGKTGNVSLFNADRTQKLDQQIGWFVGWIKKDNRTITFACLIVDKDKQRTYASLRAKEAAKEKLKQIIENYNVSES